MMDGRIISLRRGTAAAVGVLVTLIVGVGSAQATPRWLELGLLSAGGQNAFQPKVAVDPAGDAVAVWARSDGSNTIVQAATRAAGALSPAGAINGSFSAPVDLSAAGESADDPQVAVDQAGDAVVVWQRSNGSNEIVQAATRTAGGNFSAPIDLSAPGENAIAPQVGIDQAGEAFVVWERSDGTNQIVQASVRLLGRPFAPAVNLSAPGQDAFAPQVAVDPGGDAVAVWDRSNGSNTIIQGTSRPPHGSFSPPADLSATGQNAGEPQVAVDQIGDTVVVWERSDGSNEIVQALSRPRSGSTSTPVDLSAPGQNAVLPQVAVDQAGDAVVVWQRSNGTNEVVQAASESAGGSFSAPVDLSAAGQNASTPQVAVDAAGDAVALWDHDATVAFANRLAGAGFSAPADITNAGGPQLALDQTGDAVAAWVRSSGGKFVVESAGFDFAGPQLRGLSIPSSGAVGVPVPFSVSPLDVFSGSATGWIFGDGTTAPGDRNRVSHVYTFPGTYQVTVTSTDGSGNATTTTRPISISASVLSGLGVTPGRFSVAGRRAAGRCVKPNSSNRSHKHCRRTILLHVSFTLTSPSRVTLRLSPVKGSLTKSGKAGANSFVLVGAVGNRPLPVGSYHLTATPAGGVARSVAFQIVP